jgi:hypothetical protein
MCLRQVPEKEIVKDFCGLKVNEGSNWEFQKIMVGT